MSAAPSGLSAASQDGLELFTLNGIQTQSGKPLDLLDAWDEAGQIGITGLRLATDSFEVLNIASTLREAILEGRPLKRSENRFLQWLLEPYRRNAACLKSV